MGLNPSFPFHAMPDCPTSVTNLPGFFACLTSVRKPLENMLSKPGGPCHRLEWSENSRFFSGFYPVLSAFHSFASDGLKLRLSRESLKGGERDLSPARAIERWTAVDKSTVQR
jgi:hypothetical protein